MQMYIVLVINAFDKNDRHFVRTTDLERAESIANRYDKHKYYVMLYKLGDKIM